MLHLAHVGCRQFSVWSVWGSYETRADRTASTRLWLPSSAIPTGTWGTKLVLPCAQADLVPVKIFTEMTGWTGRSFKAGRRNTLPASSPRRALCCWGQTASNTQVSPFSARLGITLYPAYCAVQIAVLLFQTGRFIIQQLSRFWETRLPKTTAKGNKTGEVSVVALRRKEISLQCTDKSVLDIYCVQSGQSATRKTQASWRKFSSEALGTLGTESVC